MFPNYKIDKCVSAITTYDRKFNDIIFIEVSIRFKIKFYVYIFANWSNDILNVIYLSNGEVIYY